VATPDEIERELEECRLDANWAALVEVMRAKHGSEYSSARVAAAFDAYIQHSPRDCGLCGEPITQGIDHQLWIATRVQEGETLACRPETWCPGCARLISISPPRIH